MSISHSLSSATDSVASSIVDYASSAYASASTSGNKAKALSSAEALLDKNKDEKGLNAGQTAMDRLSESLEIKIKEEQSKTKTATDQSQATSTLETGVDESNNVNSDVAVNIEFARPALEPDSQPSNEMTQKSSASNTHAVDVMV